MGIFNLTLNLVLVLVLFGVFILGFYCGQKTINELWLEEANNRYSKGKQLRWQKYLNRYLSSGGRKRSLFFLKYYFTTREDAIKVLDDMSTFINDYGFVTLGDFHDLIGKDSTFEEYMVGWRDLNCMYIELNQFCNCYNVLLEKPYPVKIIDGGKYYGK